MNIISGGYILAKSISRTEYMSSELRPSVIYSASNCICPHFPGSAILEWTEDTEADRRSFFENLKVTPEQARDMIAWGDDKFGKDFGWPGIFYDLESAKAAKAKFFSNDKTVIVLGLGLPDEYVETFIKETSPPIAKDGEAQEGKSGYLETIEKKQPLSDGGTFLGYELLTTEYGLITHSWVCNDLEEYCYSTMGVKPNKDGFIADLEDAKRCNEEISKEEVGAEPGLWLPWAVTRYS